MLLLMLLFPPPLPTTAMGEEGGLYRLARRPTTVSIGSCVKSGRALREKYFQVHILFIVALPSSFLSLLSVPPSQPPLACGHSPTLHNLGPVCIPRSLFYFSLSLSFFSFFSFSCCSPTQCTKRIYSSL